MVKKNRPKNRLKNQSKRNPGKFQKVSVPQPPILLYLIFKHWIALFGDQIDFSVIMKESSTMNCIKKWQSYLILRFCQQLVSHHGLMELWKETMQSLVTCWKNIRKKQVLYGSSFGMGCKCKNVFAECVEVQSQSVSFWQESKLSCCFQQ